MRGLARSCLLLALVVACGHALLTATQRRRPAPSVSARTLSMKAPSGEYDYIIVGGGTAGCVLANRLSDDGNARVLVLEAGTAKYSDLMIKIPAGVLKTFKNPKYDWDFTTESEEHCRDREIYLCRGKMLGGSSCTNVLLYNRGTQHDYDSWEEEFGVTGWSGKDVLPFFKKAEDDHRGMSPEYHGRGGPIAVSDVPYQNPLSKTFLQACADEGVGHFKSDFNDWSTEQTGYGRFAVNERKGARSSAANEYLRPAQGRKNLEVTQGVQVERVLFEGKTAVGVELQTVKGNMFTAKGKRLKARLKEGGEIILASGAIGSPQTLLLSGIGPAGHLAEHGIECKANLPGVGENLQDHPAAVVAYETNPEHKGISPTSLMRISGTKLTNPLPVFKWLLKRSGVLTSTGCDHGGFFQTDADAESDAPADLQMRFLAAKALSPDGMGSFTAFRNTAGHKDGFSFQAIAVRAKSCGSVRLSSADPLAKPQVRTNYLEDPRDLASLREGLKLGRRLGNSDAFAPYRGQEVYPGPAVQTDAEIDEYIRNSVHTSNALVGTCRMGTAADASAVVDSNLRVHGVKGLRVCDASVIPRIPGGQTGAASFMIAEKGAEIIQAARDTQPAPAAAAAAPAQAPRPLVAT